MPTIVTSAGSGRSATSSYAAALPSSIVTGNLLFVVAGVFHGGRTLSLPGDWNVIEPSVGNGSIASWWKIADGSEGSTVTVSIAGGNSPVAVYTAQVSGFDVDNPIGADSSTASGSSTTPTAPSILIEHNGAITIQYAGTGGDRSFTSGTQTQLFDAKGEDAVPSAPTLGVFMNGPFDSGASGAQQLTIASAGWTTALFSINSPPLPIEPVNTLNQTGNSATPTIARTSVLASSLGNVNLCGIIHAGSITSIPTGWTQRGSTVALNATFNLSVFTKTHEGGSEPASYSWGTSSSNRWVTINSEFGEVDAANPVSVINTPIANASSTAVTAPGVDPTNTNDMLAFIGGALNSSVTWTPPTGFTEHANGQKNAASLVSLELSYKLLATDTATGDISATISTAAINGAFLVGLKNIRSIAGSGGPAAVLDAAVVASSAAAVSTLNLDHSLNASSSATGVAAVSALQLPHDLAAANIGASASAADKIAMSHPLAAAAVGSTSAISADLSVDESGAVLNAAVAGSSQVAATGLNLNHPIATSIAGSSASAITTLRLNHTFASSITASAAVAVTRLSLPNALQAAAAGSAAVQGSGLTLPRVLAGSIAASSASAATKVTVNHPLIASSAGAASVTASLFAGGAGASLGSAIAGSSAVSLSNLRLMHALNASGVSAAVFTADLSIQVFLRTAVVGGSVGAATRLTIQHALSAYTAGSSSTAATRIIVSHLLEAGAAGLSDAAATMRLQHELQALIDAGSIVTIEMSDSFLLITVSAEADSTNPISARLDNTPVIGAAVSVDTMITASAEV
jgi:hypothetical protein